MIRFISKIIIPLLFVGCGTSVKNLNVAPEPDCTNGSCPIPKSWKEVSAKEVLFKVPVSFEEPKIISEKRDFVDETIFVNSKDVSVILVSGPIELEIKPFVQYYLRKAIASGRTVFDFRTEQYNGFDVYIIGLVTEDENAYLLNSMFKYNGRVYSFVCGSLKFSNVRTECEPILKTLEAK